MNLHKLTMTIFLAVVFVAAIGGMVFFIVDMQKKLVETAALESAKLYSDALIEFRTLYTSKVVKRISKNSNFRITHNYHDDENSIPLPATMSMELGEKIGEHLSGAETHLYSPYPFQWRVNTGGVNEEFRAEAWKALSVNPDKPYYKFMNYKGRQVLRYASADIMRPACVNCHNQHPDTPKTGWEVGDVRGVLEVIHPINVIAEKNREGTRSMYIIAACVSIFGLFCLFVVARYRSTAGVLESLVKVRTTQVEDAQNEILRSKKLASLGEISANMAHEVNQPLGAAILKIQKLKRVVSKSEMDRVPEYIDNVFDCLKRIDKIITQLGSVGNTVVKRNDEALDLVALVDSAVEIMKDKFDNDGVVLKIDYRVKSIFISVDGTELERVVINLLANALHAVKDNDDSKLVTIRISVEKSEVLLQVIDNGHGIDDKTKDKIFDPFFTTKGVGEGTGLGLAMSYGIVDALGGKIDVESKLGKGSSFTVILPKDEVRR